MKVRALKRLAGSYGLLDKGDVIDLPNYIANDLIALGYAVAVEEVAAGGGVDEQRPAKGRRKRGTR